MPVNESRTTYRHRLPVRVMHWINVVCIFVLLMSGLQIFNAHPALYWGQASDFSAPALALTAKPGPIPRKSRVRLAVPESTNPADRTSAPAPTRARVERLTKRDPPGTAS